MLGQIAAWVRIGSMVPTAQDLPRKTRAGEKSAPRSAQQFHPLRGARSSFAQSPPVAEPATADRYSYLHRLPGPQPRLLTDDRKHQLGMTGAVPRTSGSSACRTIQTLYARASRSEDIAHAVIMRGSAVAMSNRRTCSIPNLRRPRLMVPCFPKKLIALF